MLLSELVHVTVVQHVDELVAKRPIGVDGDQLTSVVPVHARSMRIAQVVGGVVLTEQRDEDVMLRRIAEQHSPEKLGLIVQGSA